MTEVIDLEKKETEVILEIIIPFIVFTLLKTHYWRFNQSNSKKTNLSTSSMTKKEKSNKNCAAHFHCLETFEVHIKQRVCVWYEAQIKRKETYFQQKAVCRAMINSPRWGKYFWKEIKWFIFFSITKRNVNLWCCKTFVFMCFCFELKLFFFFVYFCSWLVCDTQPGESKHCAKDIVAASDHQPQTRTEWEPAKLLHINIVKLHKHTKEDN